MRLLIAGFVIKINFLPSKVKGYEMHFKAQLLKQFRAFQVKSHFVDKIDYTIHIAYRNDKRIIRHKEGFYINLCEYRKNNSAVMFYWISMFEFKTVLLDILGLLLEKNNGFILHASANHVKGKVYIFTGNSGVGKSTISDILSTRYKKIADEMVIIKKEDKKYYLYQIPIFEKVKIKKTSKRYQVGKVFFLRQAQFCRSNDILNKEKIFSNITKQLFLSSNFKELQLRYLSDFVSQKKFFAQLFFTNNNEKIISFIRKELSRL